MLLVGWTRYGRPVPNSGRTIPLLPGDSPYATTRRADPVDTRRRRNRAITFNGNLDPMLVKGVNQRNVQLQRRWVFHRTTHVHVYTHVRCVQHPTNNSAERDRSPLWQHCERPK